MMKKLMEKYSIVFELERQQTDTEKYMITHILMQLTRKIYTHLLSGKPFFKYVAAP